MSASPGRREYHFVEQAVAPGEFATVVLELKYKRPVPGTGIPGYPETQILTECAMETSFQPSYIEFAESCRKSFLVTACFVGQAAVWSEANAQGVTADLLAKRPDIKFPLLSGGLNMAMCVTNISPRAALLVAKVVGEDRS